MKRLIEQEACVHGEFDAHQFSYKGLVRICPGGFSREVTVDIRAGLELLRRQRPEWTPYAGDPFVFENAVNAALGGGL